MQKLKEIENTHILGYYQIHFTNKEEDSGILPKKGRFRVKRGVFEGAAQGGLKSSAR